MDQRVWVVINALHEFCQKADAFIRCGDRDAVTDRPATLELLQRVKPAFDDLDQGSQRVFVRSIHLLTDLFDKFGEYEMAARALRCYPESMREAGPSAHAGMRAEQRWVQLSESVDHHRRLGAKSAIAITTELLRDTAHEELTVDFRARLHYAHARHLQKAGLIREARASFAQALTYGEELSIQTAQEERRPRLRYAHQLVSQILVQLARILIERSYLRRASRLLAVSGALEAGMNDPINTAFINLQKGSVLRQQHKLDAAIALLEETAKTFRRERHYRYLMRCQYELAKAYLNRAELPDANMASDLENARETLAQRGKTSASHPEKFAGDDRFADRVEVRCDVLGARILLKFGEVEKARKAIDKAFERLDGPLAGTSRDVRVLATWVKGNILIELGRPADAIRVCRAWEVQRSRREPVDRTDDAFVDLVLWKAHICTGDLINAEKYMKIWTKRSPAIENVYVKAYAAQITSLHGQKFDAAYVVNPVVPEGTSDASDYWDLNVRKKELTKFILRRMIANYGGEGAAGWAARLNLSETRVRQLFKEMNMDMPPHPSRTTPLPEES
jgi:tetratricopeptide (TPR) repeat protein